MLRMLKITGVLLLALLLSGCYPGQAADFKNPRGALSAWIVYSLHMFGMPMSANKINNRN